MANKFKQRARALSAKTGMSHQAAVNQLRKEQGLPDFAGFTTVSRLFFRPFDGEATGFNRSRLAMSSEIRGRHYLVHVHGQQVEIEAEILRDKKGLVAVLKPGEHPLREGFVLEVHPELDEPFHEDSAPSVNGMLSVRREGAARKAVREATEERLGPVNLVMGNESNFTLYFEADGTMEGWHQKGRVPNGPTLAPVRTILLDNLGRPLPDSEWQPEVEFVNVQDFDATDFNKTWVPEGAYHDPSLRRQPGWPKGEPVLRAPSLNEYIAAREKETGWKLMEVRPGLPLPLSAIAPPPPPGTSLLSDVVVSVRDGPADPRVRCDDIPDDNVDRVPFRTRKRRSPWVRVLAAAAVARAAGLVEAAAARVRPAVGRDLGATRTGRVEQATRAAEAGETPHLGLESKA